MSQCCQPSQTGPSPTCPMNGKTTKPVGKKTVEHLIKPDVQSCLLPQPYYFCNDPNCDIVYVSKGRDLLITKDMLTVRVGIKETEDPIPVCYCFDFQRADIWNDIRQHNDTRIETIIRRRVKAGECRCEELNPSGGCCLGDVAQAIKHARTLKAQNRL